MKPAPFRYHAPTTLYEALATLAAVAPDDGRVLAGGQSLVPIMAFRLARPTHLVDINGVAELRRMAIVEDKLTIGACVLLAKHLTGTSWPLHRADLGLVGGACALYFASYVLRALGWQKLFPARAKCQRCRNRDTE